MRFTSWRKKKIYCSNNNISKSKTYIPHAHQAQLHDVTGENDALRMRRDRHGFHFPYQTQHTSNVCTMCVTIAWAPFLASRLLFEPSSKRTQHILTHRVRLQFPLIKLNPPSRFGRIQFCETRSMYSIFSSVPTDRSFSTPIAQSLSTALLAVLPIQHAVC